MTMNNYEHNHDVVHTYRHSSCHSCGQLVKQVDPEEEKRVWAIEKQKKQEKELEDPIKWALVKQEFKQTVLSFRPIHLWKATKWLAIRLPVHLFRSTKFMVVKTPVAIWRATKFIVSRLARLRPRHFAIAAKELGLFFRDIGDIVSDRENWMRKISYDTNPRGMFMRAMLGLTLGAILGWMFVLPMITVLAAMGISTVIRTRVENRSAKALPAKEKENG